jgi:hypothetical protein
MVEIGLSGESESPDLVAVIADIVRSRDLSDRSALQRRLKRQLLWINGRPDIVLALAQTREGENVPAALTAGDEIQCLFAHRPGHPWGHPIMETVVALTMAVFPVRVAFGLGYGPVETEIDRNVALIDGPCFHHARAALDTARKRGVWGAVRGFDDPADLPLRALFRLVGTLRGRWTETQAKYARAARNKMQKDVALEFGVGPSVVSESLKAARHLAVREGEEAIAALLNWAGQSQRERLRNAAPSEEYRRE